MKEYRIRISAARSKAEYSIDNDESKRFEMEFESKNVNGAEVPIEEVKAVVDIMFEKLVNLGKDAELEMESK